jgi:mannose-6-phosphate isomerase-like protein (cupin superfamily)
MRDPCVSFSMSRFRGGNYRWCHEVAETIFRAVQVGQQMPASRRLAVKLRTCLTLTLVLAAHPAAGQTTADARLVVTGHSPEGRAIFESDGPPSEVIRFQTLPGYEITSLWTTKSDGSSGLDSGPETMSPGKFVPGPGETRLLLFRLPSPTELAAAAEAGSTPESIMKEFRTKLPDLTASADPETGLHSTPTVDYVIVLSGTVLMELDDGAMVTLGPGDVVVQNATAHAWYNGGEEGAVLAAVLVGGQP